MREIQRRSRHVTMALIPPGKHQSVNDTTIRLLNVTVSVENSSQCREARRARRSTSSHSSHF
jgi:hypothetical protein